MKPADDKLIEHLQQGFEEACNVSISNTLAADTKELREFSGRMSIRLFWAMNRIIELEAQQSVRSSWDGEVDRQGGQFTQEEINRSGRW